MRPFQAGRQGIGFLYDGVHFRSRTEARWAKFLDLAGIYWEYEKDIYVKDYIDGVEIHSLIAVSDLDRKAGTYPIYLPDFTCPDHGLVIEVKPTYSILSKEIEKVQDFHRFLKRRGKRFVLACGWPDAAPNYDPPWKEGVFEPDDRGKIVPVKFPMGDIFGLDAVRAWECVTQARNL